MSSASATYPYPILQQLLCWLYPQLRFLFWTHSYSVLLGIQHLDTSSSISYLCSLAVLPLRCHVDDRTILDQQILSFHCLPISIVKDRNSVRCYLLFDLLLQLPHHASLFFFFYCFSHLVPKWLYLYLVTIECMHPVLTPNLLCSKGCP